ncbi:DUF2855 family protein [Aliiglaciecola sp. LCG003]|uniref:DUF2855 family protein n=1 Tax=Aliiglaciecola sp. LCG003 TaxID=3053655 RepID=UPI0025748192|nr:DUF2855 family protein [Aliiglaciecola sp. LCG003]WJG07986.1 DUF2855 family protein [Aliiglaciecola sp. LCG003]
MTTITNTQIQINQSDLTDLKIVHKSFNTSELGPDQVLLKVQSFGFSANNITYALLGSQMGYWGFFEASSGFGIMPVWGFATVEQSNHRDLKVGEKVFGYLPFATHLRITAGKTTESNFYDVNPTRKSISPVYDQYIRCAKDPGYDPAQEVWQLNFRPLFMTSFVLDDFVAEHITDSTLQIIITSASSKTAYGAAFLLKHFKSTRAGNYRVIGLTSPSNLIFTEKSGCYDEVLSYDEYEGISNKDDAIVLDFSGNKPLLLNLQTHLAEYMQSMIYIGVTDVKSQMKRFEGDLKGEFFFAPSQVKKRTQEWGGQGFMQRYGNAWSAFFEHIKPLLHTHNCTGVEAICDLYHQGLAGNFDTSQLYYVRFEE